MMFNTHPVFTIRMVDTVTYGEPDGQLVMAVVEGHGRHKGRRIVRPDNGSWCFREDIRSVARAQKRK
jgi:hypothetical protein